ncbi:MAG: DUF6492 family protein [Flavobacterium sp.]
MFDIVIPLGPNERRNIQRQIEYTKQNVIGYRHIYVVTNTSEPMDLDGCIIVDESIYPFKMADIASYFIQHNGKSNRNGWYFQQLIKLYSAFVIKDILDDYLVIDADVFFLKPIEFMKDGKSIFTIGNEYHVPYFTHMERLHPSLVRSFKQSGIAHHMLFSKKYLNELFSMVEHYHSKSFWIVFIEAVNEHRNHPIHAQESGASEYEIYFHFMVSRFGENIIVRQLRWENKNMSFKLDNAHNLEYVSLCSWMNY